MMSANDATWPRVLRDMEVKGTNIRIIGRMDGGPSEDEFRIKIEAESIPDGMGCERWLAVNDPRILKLIISQLIKEANFL